MTKGVALLAIGSEGYMWWACNMACSIKHFSPSLPIQLVASMDFIVKIKAQGLDVLFDVITEIKPEQYMDGNKLNPGKAKLGLYPMFAFDKTLYLDVDGLIMKDISPLFETGDSFIAHVMQEYIIGEDEKPKDMYWCDSSVIMAHYNIAPETKMVATNTSSYMVTKSAENERLFALAYSNVTDNPIPREKQYKTWGRGKGLQPDELYLNIACAQTGIYPVNKHLFYFRIATETGKIIPLSVLRETFYGIGLYGNEDRNHVTMKPLYDAILRPIWNERFPKIRYFKADQLMPCKIANFKHQ